jgi:phosphodiesterase/alkaline phosphatase D-like protein
VDQGALSRRSLLLGGLAVAGGSVLAGVLARSATSPDGAADTVTSVVPTLVHRVVGIPTNEIGWVAVRTTDTGSVWLKVGTDAAVTQNVIYGPPSTPNAQGDSTLTVSGLTADTQYYYRIAMATDDGSEHLDSGTVGRFCTAPVGQASFAFNFGSCCDATDSAAMAAVAARDDALFFHLGDLYYADKSGTDVSNFRSEIVAKIQAPNHAAVFRGTACAFIPSDHDGMNNDSANGSDSRAWTNYNRAYRELIPTPTLPESKGVYYTFTWGRVRFILLDTRSFKSDPSDTDNRSKTALGSTQKQWLKDAITNDDTSRVFIVVQDSTWNGSGEDGEDDWHGYVTERDELAEFFDASGKTIGIIGGDMHAVAADDGTNHPGLDFAFQAAPFNNTASRRGGKYSEGVYPSSGTSTVQQYGRVVVTDSGSSVTLAFTGYSSDNTARISLTKNFAAETVP